jgi:hemerythrin-like domain-containing protein
MLIKEIDRQDPAGDPWLATVKKLRGALEQHIRKEEQEIWPRIERVWNPARLEEAGRQMEAMKHGQAAKAH